MWCTCGHLTGYHVNNTSRCYAGSCECLGVTLDDRSVALLLAWDTHVPSRELYTETNVKVGGGMAEWEDLAARLAANRDARAAKRVQRLRRVLEKERRRHAAAQARWARVLDMVTLEAARLERNNSDN